MDSVDGPLVVGRRLCHYHPRRVRRYVVVLSRRCRQVFVVDVDGVDRSLLPMTRRRGQCRWSFSRRYVTPNLIIIVCIDRSLILPSASREAG